MTAAKPHHLAARRLLLDHLDLHPGKTVGNDLDPLEAGVVGDTAHAEGGDSYHLGKDKIRAKAGRTRYSVDESARDLRGLDNYASGMDIGYFKVVTPRGMFDLYDFNAWLITLCKGGDPDTQDLREVIYSPDGKTVKRWDHVGKRSTGDNSHLTHTHLSEYRDADGHRMVRLVTRWLQHIGLIPEEDDVALSDTDIDKIATRAAEKVWTYLITDFASMATPKRRLPAATWLGYSDSRHITTRAAITAGLASVDQVDEQALGATIAAAVVATLPDDRDDVTVAELEQALRAILADLATRTA